MNIYQKTINQIVKGNLKKICWRDEDFRRFRKMARRELKSTNGIKELMGFKGLNKNAEFN